MEVEASAQPEVKVAVTNQNEMKSETNGSQTGSGSVAMAV